MARQRRTFDEQIAELTTRGRVERTTVLSTPAMAAVGPSMIEPNAVVNEHLAAGAVALTNLDDSLKDTLESLAGNEIALAEAQQRLDESALRIDDLFDEVAIVPTQIETARSSAVETAATDAQTKANKALADAKVDAEAKATAAKNAAIAAAAADAKAQAEAAESRAATTAATDAKAKADAAQAAALAAAKTYADTQASGAGGMALEEAKADATSKANAAKAAAIEAAAAETKAKTEAAEARAATDAATKANKALTDAKVDATTKADAAKTAAVAAAATDATTKANAAQAAAITAADTAAKATAKSAAEAAEARVALAAAADAQTKATAAQNAALTAAKTYADTQASGASSDALEAAKQDATTKANNAKQAAIDAAALDATAKAEQAEADAAADAKSKADEALRLAKIDAGTKATNAQTAAAADATAKLLLAASQGQSLVLNGNFDAGAEGWNVVAFTEIIPAAKRGGTNGLRLTPTNGNVWITNQWVPTAPGRVYHMEMWVRRTGTDLSPGTRVVAGFVPQTRNTAGGTATPIANGVLDDGTPATVANIPTDTFVRVTARHTISPEGVTAVRFSPWVYKSGNFYDIDDMLVVDVTEAVAAQAAAAVDAKGKADESLRLAKIDAETKANDAKQAAIDAAGEVTISKMNQVANSKNATYYGTVAPTATAPKGSLAGDTYRRRNAAGNIIGEWEWTITNNVGAWVQRKMTSESMTAVDVGVLTAGSAVIQDAVAQTLAAATATIQKADIGNLTVTGTSNLADAVARTIAANTGKFISVTTDQLAAGNAVIGTGVADKFFTDIFSTRKLFANQVLIGEPGNMHPDPNFLDRAGWGNRVIVASGGRNGSNALEIPASTVQSGTYYGGTDRNRQFAVTGGGTYRVAVWVKPDAAAPANSLSVYMKWSNPSTAVAGSFATPSVLSNTAAIAAGVWTEITGTVTVGADATHGHVGLFSQTAYSGRVLFSQLSIQQVITPSLVVDGLMDGKRIVGATIETDKRANTGVKLDNAGVVAHGLGKMYDPVAKKDITYNMEARLTQRTAGWSNFPTDILPGLWFESSGSDAGTAPPMYPAGLVASGPDAEGVALESSQQNGALDYRSSVTVHQNMAAMAAQSNRTSATAIPRDSTSHRVTPTGWLTESKADGVTTYVSGGGENGEILMQSAGGVAVSHSEGARMARIPLGLLDRWTSGANIDIRSDSTIVSRTVLVPAHANIRVNISLRGYPLSDETFVSIYAAANSRGFGESRHYARRNGYTTDIRTSYIYKHGAAPALVAFRVAGATIAPTSATYRVPAAGDHIPTTEVYFEDLGDA